MHLRKYVYRKFTFSTLRCHGHCGIKTSGLSKQLFRTSFYWFYRIAVFMIENILFNWHFLEKLCTNCHDIKLLWVCDFIYNSVVSGTQWSQTLRCQWHHRFSAICFATVKIAQKYLQNREPLYTNHLAHKSWVQMEWKNSSKSLWKRLVKMESLTFEKYWTLLGLRGVIDSA